jgi:hypothetical protein
VLNVIALLLTLIEEHTIWLYAACFLAILLCMRSYWVAHRQRQNTVFTIEKEIAAHREGRAMSGVGALLGVAVVITGIKHYIVPTLDVASIVEPTPTLTIPVPPTTVVVVATRTPTPEPQATAPGPSASPSPTPSPTEDLPPTDTPPPPPPPVLCADPNICITSPGNGATVSGMVSIIGTADHGQFQFYKVEYGQGEQPGSWHVINDVHRSPVHGGVLEQLNAGALPNGVYWIRLVVVDQSGNFPPPSQVRIVVQN